MIKLAWAKLTHNLFRTAVAVTGVTFAVVLMFMQLGFLGAVERTATVIYDALEFDVLLRSPTYLHVSSPRWFPRQRLQQAASVPGVQNAAPFYISINTWYNDRVHDRFGILTMAARPGDHVFRHEELRTKSRELANGRAILIDRKSQSKYGPVNERKFGDDDIGEQAEVGPRQMRLAGTFELGTGLAANAAVYMTADGFVQSGRGRSVNDISLGLVQLPQPATAADRTLAAERIRETLSGQPDVVVLSREQAVRRERRYWLFDKSIGAIFLTGVVVAFIVGLAIVHHVLASDVNRNLGEFATLKAMGYGNRFLSGIVVLQAAVLACAGFLTGLVVSLVLYAITSVGAGIAIKMDLRTMVLVFFVSLTMCCLSGLAALRKAWRAEPADLF